MSDDNALIYMDYAATTPVDPLVAREMQSCLTLEGDFGNPASESHAAGKAAAMRVAQARDQVASTIGAKATEIIWTSGATESINLALIGACRFYAERGRHLITARTEHKAVLDTCSYLENSGWKVSYLRPAQNGIIEPGQVAEAITGQTTLVSLMHVNNEIGVIQDIAALGRLCREHNVLLHVDSAQSAGKLPIDVQGMEIDLMSLSAHKLYGPKGIGALFVSARPACHLQPRSFGGGHERGLRAGTLPTHQIVGMGEAFALGARRRVNDEQHIAGLAERLWCGIRDLDGVMVNGDVQRRLPGILNVSFAGVEGESLRLALGGLAVSSGAACDSMSGDGSYVLRALGRSDQEGQSSIRFSLGRFSRSGEIDSAIELIREQLGRLRRVANSHTASERHIG